MREAISPRTVTQLRSFLGAANVNRRFINGLAKTAALLYEFLRDLPEGGGKGSKLPNDLNEHAMLAFRTLVDAMWSPPVLALPAAAHRFLVDTDASPYQIGVALFRKMKIASAARWGIGHAN